MHILDGFQLWLCNKYPFSMPANSRDSLDYYASAHLYKRIFQIEMLVWLVGWLVGWCLCAMCMVITNEISSSSENVFNLCAVSIVAKFRKCYATHTNTPGHTCCKPALIRCSIQTTNWINEQIHNTHSCKMRWQNKTEIVMSPQWWKGKSCLFK